MIKKCIVFASLLFFSSIPCSYAAVVDEYYRSQLQNQSSQGATPYTLVQTQAWPETGCITEPGKEVLKPGDATELVIAKKNGCSQAGVGYSLYKASDLKREQLLGYVSHRFRDGRFSLQVSIFCQGGQCIFKDLNPEQNKKP